MCFTNPICIFFYFFGVTMSSRTGRYAVIGCKLKQNANEGCNSCASLAGFVLCFIACFILLVIAPLLLMRGASSWPLTQSDGRFCHIRQNMSCMVCLQICETCLTTCHYTCSTPTTRGWLTSFGLTLMSHATAATSSTTKLCGANSRGVPHKTKEKV